MENDGKEGVGQRIVSDLAGIENQHDLEPNVTKDEENEYPSIKESLSSLCRCFDYINGDMKCGNPFVIKRLPDHSPFLRARRRIKALERRRIRALDYTRAYCVICVRNNSQRLPHLLRQMSVQTCQSFRIASHTPITW